MNLRMSIVSISGYLPLSCGGFGSFLLRGNSARNISASSIACARILDVIGLGFPLSYSSTYSIPVATCQGLAFSSDLDNLQRDILTAVQKAGHLPIIHSFIHDTSPRAGLVGFGIVSGVLGSSRSGRSWPRSSSSWARHHPLVLCSSCGAHPAMPTRSPTAHQAASSAVPVPAGFAASFASPAAAFAAQRIQLLFPPLVHLPLHHPSSWARASAVSASAPVWARKPSMSS